MDGNGRQYWYGWRNNERRRELYGRMFRVLCRGRMNSALVEFVDNGQCEVISRNALRGGDPPRAGLDRKEKV